MPTGDDLIGVGVPNMVANIIGNTPSTLVCLGTSSQANSAPILSHLVELTAASGSANGAVLPSSAKIGTPYYFVTSTSTAAIVYVPSGHSLNGSSNGGITCAQWKGCIAWQYKSKNWTYVILA